MDTQILFTREFGVDVSKKTQPVDFEVFLPRIVCPARVLEEVSRFERPLTDILAISSSALPSLRSELPALKNWADELKGYLNSTSPALLLDFDKSVKAELDINTFRAFTVLLGYAMGELVVQNEQGDRLITVFDRDRTKTMREGARYHQTREGGTIHTDNVNIPERWHYLLLTCLAQAPVGGENILVDGRKIHALLKARFPKVLAVLEAPFWWEKRGVADALYEAPIVVYENGEPLFRHLRPYMESAHAKSGVPLTDEQMYAIDVLDALTNSTDNQVHYRMQPFETLLTVDAQVLHGRQCFADELETIDLPTYLAKPPAERAALALRRTMERLWIRK
jgi:hypothetical protein